MKILLIVFIAIALLSTAYFSGPILVVIALVASLVYLALREIYRGMDLNKDGEVNLDDLRYLFGRNPASTDDPEKSKQRAESFMEKRLHKLWSGLEQQFVLLSASIQAREKQAHKSWRQIWGNRHQRDVTRAIELLARELEDPILSDRQSDFLAITQALIRKRKQLAEIEGAIAMSFGKVAGSKARAKEATEAKIQQLETQRRKSVELFRERLQSYGLTLSQEQVEVLLSRIDSSDVGQMAVTFALISRLTSQLAAAKAGSSENLDVARKYYGIYIGLLELQLHIQSKYIENVSNEYLPGVQKLGAEARQLLTATRAKLNASETALKTGYESNLRAQKFTIRVTDLYSSTLSNDRAKVQEARELVRKQHELAENTLKTVRVSADLSSFIQQGEQMYTQIMDLQTPALVPFENLQMQREFEELTSRLRV